MKTLLLIVATLGVLATMKVAHAEPYLAIRSGQKCMACHVNPAGGGKRTNFGRIYGQTVMPARSSEELILEDVSRYLDIGADVRGSLTLDQTPGEDDQLAFTNDRASVYIEAQLIPKRLSLYLDERFAPGASNREAWMMLKSRNQKNFMQAGSFFLPYGLRIEDDTASIRQATGVSFNNADNGVMIGRDSGPWSTRASLTNGTNGGAETNLAKQLSLRTAYIQPGWRLGVSGNTNRGTSGTARHMFNAFGGLKRWGMEWLGEIDWVSDRGDDTGTRNQYIGYLEANKELRRGHNLKATFEWLDPDNDVNQDHRTRTSLVWEYTPLAMFQVRLGTRIGDGIPQNPQQNADQVFLQLHAWY